MWVQDALSAWAREEHTKVPALAPIAVEHLGKALLWNTNPVLVLPLSSQYEAVLMELATNPEFASPKLRTIGLDLVLGRVRRLLGALDVTEESCRRLVAARNGSIHVGTAGQARDVLTDSLTLLNTFLDALDLPAEQLYGDYGSTARVLVTEHQSAVEKTVAEKMARARHKLIEMENTLTSEAFDAATNEMERQARFDAEVNLSPEDGALEQSCPECGSQGMLCGWLELDPVVDWDHEPMGGGQYRAIPVGSWDVFLHPREFFCTVCGLTLSDRQELGATGLPAGEKLDVGPGDLGPSFDPDETARWMHERE
jgi:hypothetical protein